MEDPPIKCSSFTAKTTGVSNPVCYLGFRASASGVAQGSAFATDVPLDIYAFHCYTENSDPPYNPLAMQSCERSKVEPWYLTRNLHCRLRALYAQ